MYISIINIISPRRRFYDLHGSGENNSCTSFTIHMATAILPSSTIFGTDFSVPTEGPMQAWQYHTRSLARAVKPGFLAATQSPARSGGSGAGRRLMCGSPAPYPADHDRQTARPLRDRAVAGCATSVGLRPPCVTHPATLSHPD